EKHDAGQYVPSLLSKNLSYAVVEDNSVNRALLQDKKNVFFVVDSTRFLQDLAHAKLTYWRQQNGERKVLALTGSNGKTTTKEMLAWLLKAYPKLVHVTKGNLNNHLGVPFTILDMPLESEVLVLEMGTNHPGEIELLCQ